MKTSIYLPDELAEAARKHGISISDIVQRAVRQEIRKMETSTDEQIVVQMADGKRGFFGRWLVAPPTSTPSLMGHRDPFPSFGVAITKKAKIVVYKVDPVNAPSLTVYGTLAEVGYFVPDDVIKRAAEALNNQEVKWMDV